MPESGSVSHWLGLLKDGKSEAAQRLWERFYVRLVELSHGKLRGLPRGGADSEDIALSAFNRFCIAAKRGQFPRLEDRNDLWQVLALIAERKARDYGRHELRQKRGGNKVLDEAALNCGAIGLDGELGLEALVSQEPTPAFAAQMAEELGLLLGCLNDEVLQGIAVAKMEGLTNEELAKKLDCSLSTIERKLKLIRQIWSRRAPDDQRSSPT